MKLMTSDIHGIRYLGLKYASIDREEDVRCAYQKDRKLPTAALQINPMNLTHTNLQTQFYRPLPTPSALALLILIHPRSIPSFTSKAKPTHPNKRHNPRFYIHKHLDDFPILFHPIDKPPNFIQIPEPSPLGLRFLNVTDFCLEIFERGRLEIGNVLRGEAKSKGGEYAGEG